MKMTVEDVLKLSYLGDVEIIAGSKGLKREVKSVGILDYEPTNELNQHFFKGDFMITSFYTLKDHPEELIKTVQSLFAIGVAAIAVKNVIFKELPEEVKTFCNRKGLPLLSYPYKVLSEQVIFEIIKALKDDEKDDYLASKIYGLIQSKLGPLMVKKIAYEINPHFYDHVKVIYFAQQNDPRQIMSTINNGPYKDVGIRALLFDGGVLLMVSYSDEIKTESLITRFGLSDTELRYGESQSYALERIDRAISESIIAYKASVVAHRKGQPFETIGFYQWMIPLLENEWLSHYAEGILDPLIAYDHKQKSDILATLINFIQHNGDFKKTAEKLFQHINTVRYKIAKAESILGLDPSMMGVYEQLSVAVHYHLCQKNKM